ncbi:unnamed protein product [Pedinophyceae sp. YPF-701]|nr:unnamed protein product [Pedinophyceae sp. YPF-701]
MLGNTHGDASDGGRARQGSSGAVLATPPVGRVLTSLQHLAGQGPTPILTRVHAPTSDVEMKDSGVVGATPPTITAHRQASISNDSIPTDPRNARRAAGNAALGPHLARDLSRTLTLQGWDGPLAGAAPQDPRATKQDPHEAPAGQERPSRGIVRRMDLTVDVGSPAAAPPRASWDDGPVPPHRAGTPTVEDADMQTPAGQATPSATAAHGPPSCPPSPPGRRALDSRAVLRQSSLNESRLLLKTKQYRSFRRRAAGANNAPGGATTPAGMPPTPKTFRFADYFEHLSVIARSHFSEVFKVRCKASGALYAVKVLTRRITSRAHRESCIREVKVVQDLPPHPNVVAYLKCWQESRRVHLQMELCRQGSLAGLLRRAAGMGLQGLPEPRVWQVARDMASALELIHSRNILHLDLKPDNILISDGVFKLGDFGLAVSRDAANWEEGDGDYVAPELLSTATVPAPAADMYSLGCSLYECATGTRLPRSGPLRTGEGIALPGCSPALHVLVSKLLRADPEARPTARDVLHGLAQLHVEDQLPRTSGLAQAQGASPDGSRRVSQGGSVDGSEDCMSLASEGGSQNNAERRMHLGAFFNGRGRRTAFHTVGSGGRGAGGASNAVHPAPPPGAGHSTYARKSLEHHDRGWAASRPARNRLHSPATPASPVGSFVGFGGVHRSRQRSFRTETPPPVDALMAADPFEGAPQPPPQQRTSKLRKIVRFGRSSASGVREDGPTGRASPTDALPWLRGPATARGPSQRASMQESMPVQEPAAVLRLLPQRPRHLYAAGLGHGSMTNLGDSSVLESSLHGGVSRNGSVAALSGHAMSRARTPSALSLHSQGESALCMSVLEPGFSLEVLGDHEIPGGFEGLFERGSSVPEDAAAHAAGVAAAEAALPTVHEDDGDEPRQGSPHECVRPSFQSTHVTSATAVSIGTRICGGSASGGMKTSLSESLGGGNVVGRPTMSLNLDAGPPTAPTADQHSGDGPSPNLARRRAVARVDDDVGPSAPAAPARVVPRRPVAPPLTPMKTPRARWATGQGDGSRGEGEECDVAPTAPNGPLKRQHSLRPSRLLFGGDDDVGEDELLKSAPPARGWDDVGSPTDAHPPRRRSGGARPVALCFDDVEGGSQSPVANRATIAQPHGISDTPRSCTLQALGPAVVQTPTLGWPSVRRCESPRMSGSPGDAQRRATRQDDFRCSEEGVLGGGVSNVAAGLVNASPRLLPSQRRRNGTGRAVPTALFAQAAAGNLGHSAHGVDPASRAASPITSLAGTGRSSPACQLLPRVRSDRSVYPWGPRNSLGRASGGGAGLACNETLLATGSTAALDVLGATHAAERGRAWPSESEDFAATPNSRFSMEVPHDVHACEDAEGGRLGAFDPRGISGPARKGPRQYMRRSASVNNNLYMEMLCAGAEGKGNDPVVGSSGGDDMSL